RQAPAAAAPHARTDPARRRNEPGPAVARPRGAAAAARPGRHPVGLLRPTRPDVARPAALTPPAPRGTPLQRPGAGGARVPVQAADAVPQPGGGRAEAAGRSATAAQGVPEELRRLLPRAARAGRPDAGGLPPGPHRRAGRSRPRRLPDAPANPEI